MNEALGFDLNEDAVEPINSSIKEYLPEEIAESVSKNEIDEGLLVTINVLRDGRLLVGVDGRAERQSLDNREPVIPISLVPAAFAVDKTVANDRYCVTLYIDNMEIHVCL